MRSDDESFRRMTKGGKQLEVGLLTGGDCMHLMDQWTGAMVGLVPSRVTEVTLN